MAPRDQRGAGPGRKEGRGTGKEKEENPQPGYATHALRSSYDDEDQEIWARQPADSASSRFNPAQRFLAGLMEEPHRAGRPGQALGRWDDHVKYVVDTPLWEALEGRARAGRRLGKGPPAQPGKGAAAKV